MNSVDKRIVEMQFDNKQFESGIQTSLKSLTNLDKGLKDAGNGDSLAGLTSAVQTISDRFSTLGIVGMTVLQNITNAALNAATSMIKALTFEPAMDGFNEYELKMNTVQTVMNGTGLAAQEVQKELERLDEYADKTIYGTKDMFDNIQTFTNMDIPLDKATTAMIGIANATALAGGDAGKAMYAYRNFADGISSGYLMLKDFNSLQNVAKVMTTEMREQLMNAAVAAGTLTKGMDGVYTTQKGTIVTTKNFGATLRDQWLTTEVLTDTLNDYGDATTEIGAKAWAAAQDVKTFSQLVETIKAGLGTSWAKTFELVIGNLDESKELFTDLSVAIGGLIGSFSESRNEMLQFWHDNGGREALIEAITNAFSGLKAILTPVIQAFREVFPPMTGERLLALTVGLKELTANFKIGEKTAENIRKTFKGLVSVIDLGIQIVSAIIGAFVDLIGFALPAGDGILGVTAAIGDFLSGLNDAAKDTDIFRVVLGKFVDFIKAIPTAIAAVASEIAKTFTELTGIELRFPSLENLSEFLGSLRDKLPSVGGAFESARSGITNFLISIKDSLSGAKTALTEFFSPVTNLAKNAWNGIKTFLTDAKNAIVGFFNGFESDTIVGITAGGLFAGVILGIKKLVDAIKEFLSPGNSIVGSITGVLDSVRETFEAYQNVLKADILMKIAKAIAILVAAIVVLSFIDPNKLYPALAAMTAAFAELMGAMAVINKLSKGSDIKGLNGMVLPMLAMSTAVLILSSALKSISELDWDAIFKGLVGVAGLSAILVASANLMSSSSGKLLQGSLGLNAFASALLIMVNVVEALGAFDLPTLTKGLIGVGVLVAELTVFMNLAGKNKMSIGAGLGFLALSAALLVLSDAVEVFAAMDTGKMIKGLAAIGIVLLELGVFTKLSGNASHMISTGIGMIALGAAMHIFSDAIEEMGNFSWETIAKGLITMGGALAAITIAVNFLPKNLPVIGIGLIGIATALNILSSAMQSMGGMGWEEIGKSLVVLAGSMTIIAVAMNFMTTALPGAAALLVISAALTIFVPVFALLGSLPLAVIGAGLLALAGAFTVLGIAGYVLAPVAPVILALAAALTLVGVGMLAAGAGVAIFSTALLAFAGVSVASATAIVAALGIIVTGVANLIPTVAKGLGEGIITFASTIASGAAAISAAVVVVITAIVNALVQSIPVVVNGVMQLILSLLQAILQYGPQIITTVVQIIVALLGALGQAVPLLINAGIQLMVDFINGMANGIRDNAETVFAAVRNLMSSIIEFAIAALAELVRMIPVVGGQMEAELTAAKEKVREVLAPESMAQIGTDGMNAVATGMTTSAPVVQEAASSTATSATTGLTEGLTPAFDIGSIGGTDFAAGLMGTSSLAEGSGIDLSGTMLTGLSSNQPEYAQLGAQYGQDFSDNLQQNQTSAQQAGETITEAAEQGLKSNETVFPQTGEKYGTDFATNLSNQQTAAKISGTNVTTQAEQGLKSNTPVWGQTGDKYGTDFANNLDNKKVAAKTAATQLTTYAEDGLKTNSEIFGETGEKYGDDFAGGISDKQDAAKEAGVAVTTKGADGVASLNGEDGPWVVSGVNAAQGFINGILSMVDEAAEAAAELAAEAMDAAMDELDENSPSKEMEKVGINFDLGFINGIKKLAGAAANMARDVGGKALSSMQDAISKVADVVNSDLDSSPTIRPVLDLTDIQNGVQSINQMFGITRGLVVKGANANAIQVANQMRSSSNSKVKETPNQQSANGNRYEFNQYNTSPKALSRIEIYRQTKNQFAQLKGLVEGT
jgi:hypothetical protein